MALPCADGKGKRREACMCGILAAVCLLFAGSPNLDGEAAVEKAQWLLAKLGVSEPTRLESLQDHHYVTKNKCWAMGLSLPHGKVTVVLDARTGQALFIQTEPMPAVSSANRISTPEQTRRANALLHTLGYDRDVKLGPFHAADAHGPTCALFYRTAHGLPFFNLNPTYGHQLWFDPGTGAINYLLPSPTLPEVNAWRPNISATAAVAKISAWAGDRVRRKHHDFRVAETQGPLTPELGYWKFEKQTTARLVWRATPYVTNRGKVIEMGAYRVFVDALTGEVVEPDDPLMGANP